MPSISPSLVLSMGPKGIDLIKSFTEEVNKGDHSMSQFIETAVIGFNEEKEIGVKSYETFEKEGQKGEYWLKLSKSQPVESLAQQIDEIYNDLISLENIRADFEFEVNDKVILTIIIPVYDLGSGIATRLLLQAIDSLLNDNIISNLTTKLVCVLQDYEKERISYSEEHFVGLTNLEKNVKEFEHLVDHVFFIDNKNINHQALKFNDYSLGYALVEFISALMLHHYRLLGALTGKYMIFGLSSIHFSQKLFNEYCQNYLLSELLDTQNVNEKDSIDADAIISKTNAALTTNMAVLDDFLKSHYVENFIREDYDSGRELEVLGKLNEVAEEGFKKTEERIFEFLNTGQTSLIHNKAIISNLLGNNIRALSGDIFITDRLTLEDVQWDIFEFFNRKRPAEDRFDFEGLKKLNWEVSNSENYLKRNQEELDRIKELEDLIEKDQSISLNNGVFSINGVEISSDGYKPEKNIVGFKEFEVQENLQLPAFVNLQNEFSKVKNQERVGACTAFATTALYEHAGLKFSNTEYQMSELYVYYNARLKRSKHVSDSGISITETMMAVKEYGACFLDSWPFKLDKVNTKPSRRAYTEGKKHLAKEIEKVNLNEQDIKGALAQGLPIVFGLKVYESFAQPTKDGIINYPTSDELKEDNHTWHAMVILGYSEQEKMFVVRNSWGSDWGDKGYCYIPFDYLLNEEFSNEHFVITEFLDLVVVDSVEIDHSENLFFSIQNYGLKKALLQYEKRQALRKLELLKEEYHLQQAKLNESKAWIYNSFNRDKMLREEIQLIEMSAVEEPMEEDEELDKSPFKFWPFILGVGVVGLISSAFLLGIPFIIASILIIILGVVLFFFERKKQLPGEEKENVTKENLNVKKEIRDLKYKYKIAALFLDRSSRLEKGLVDRLQVLQAFISGMESWKKRINANLNDLNRSFNSPVFVIEILDVKKLNKFLNSVKSKLIEQIPNLSDSFNEKYNELKLKGNEQLTFQEQADNIKVDLKRVIAIILKESRDFSLVNYYTNQKSYDFLNDPIEIRVLSKKLSELAAPFANYDTGLEQNKTHHVVLKEENYNDDVDTFFKDEFCSSIPHNSPSFVGVKSKNKLTYISIYSDVNPVHLTSTMASRHSHKKNIKTTSFDEYLI